MKEKHRAAAPNLSFLVQIHYKVGQTSSLFGPWQIRWGMRFYISCRFQFGAGCATGANWAGIAVSSAHFARPFKWASAAAAASGFASARESKERARCRRCGCSRHSTSTCARPPHGNIPPHNAIAPLFLPRIVRGSSLSVRRWRQLELWPCDAILSPDIHALCVHCGFSLGAVCFPLKWAAPLYPEFFSTYPAHDSLTKGAGRDRLDGGPLAREQQVHS